MSSLNAFAGAGIRSRPIHSQIGVSERRERRPTRLWSAGSSIRNGSSGVKNIRAASPTRPTGWPSPRIARRSSWSTSALPAFSSPRSVRAQAPRPAWRRFRLEAFEIVAQPFDGRAFARHGHTTAFLRLARFNGGPLEKGVTENPYKTGIGRGTVAASQPTIIQLPSGLRQAAPWPICGWPSI